MKLSFFAIIFLFNASSILAMETSKKLYRSRSNSISVYHETIKTLFILLENKAGNFDKPISLSTIEQDNSEKVERVTIELCPTFDIRNVENRLEKLKKDLEDKKLNYEECKPLIEHIYLLQNVNNQCNVREQQILVDSLVTFFKNPVSLAQAQRLYKEVPGIALVRKPSDDLIILKQSPS